MNRGAAVLGLQWLAWGAACFLLVAIVATLARGLGGLVWPASGIAVAAALHVGARIWPAIALGAFAGELAAGAGIAAGGVSALVLSVETIAAGWLFGRAIELRPSLERLRDALTLFFGTLGVAALGALAGVLAGPAPVNPLNAWLAWWTRDALGVLFVAPLATTWLARPRRAIESGEPLGDWVLRAACRQGRDWNSSGAPRIAVNCSVRQFNPALVDSVQEAVRSSGIDPARLEIEITESLLMSNAEQNIGILRRLSDLGVQVAIDDFGTGFSSLGYLRRLKIDAVKIDRTFVRDITQRPDDVAIVRAIVALAHSLRMKVVAEGIETEEQRELLASLDCDEGQGHLFSPPVSAQRFAQALGPERLRAN